MTAYLACVLAAAVLSCDKGVLDPGQEPVAHIDLSPDSTTIAVGDELRPQAEVRDANGGLIRGLRLFWDSEFDSVATVTAPGVIKGMSPGVTRIAASAEGKDDLLTLVVVEAEPATVEIRPSDTSVRKGQQIRLEAIVRDSLGNELKTKPVTWSTDVEPKVTVEAIDDTTALVTGVDIGTDTITATATSTTGPVTGTARVEVTLAPVGSVTIEPASLALLVNTKHQLAVTVRDPAGVVLDNRTVEWSSFDPAVAVVSSTGEVTALTAGTTTITATVEGVSASIGVEVSVVPVNAVVVSPSTGSVLVGGPALQLTAQVLDENNTQLVGRAVTWSSSNPAIAKVASVDPAAGTATITGVAVGQATIQARSEGKTGVSKITVSTVPVGRVEVTATDTTFVVGGTVQMTATAYSGNQELPGRAVSSWRSSDPAVAVVNGNGLVTGLAPGTATITAIIDGVPGTLSLTVTPVPVASVAVTPTAASIVVNQSVQLTAVARDANGAVLTGRAVTWTSENADLAAVLQTGEVLGRAVGTTTVHATIESQTASATITVTPPPISAVVVSPAGPQIFVGGTVDLDAQVTNSAGQVVLGAPLSWRSLSPDVATVDASGVVTGVAPGTAEIEATSEGKVGTTTVTVSAVPVRSVTVTPSTAELTVGQTVQLTATPRDADNQPLAGRDIAWASIDAGIATVSSTGLVTAVAPGTVNITATSEGRTGTAQITVKPAPVQAVTVSPNTATLVVGQERTLTAAVTGAGGEPLDRPVTWSSSDTRVAVVESDGAAASAKVIAVAVGRATITASSGGMSGTAAITVNAVPVASVSVTPATASLTVGQSARFSAQPRDADGNALSGRTVTWSSDDDDVATVDQTGRVVAVGVGTAAIRATSGGVSGTAAVTVIPVPVGSVEVDPPAPSLTVGQTVQLDAIVRDPAGNTLSGRAVSWQSSDPAVATVSESGLVTAVAQGTANVTATSEGKTGTAAVSVSPVPVASVRISSATLTLIVGETESLSAEGLDAENRVLPGRQVTWTSDDESIATVDDDGAVTGVAPGNTTIRATIEGKTATAAVTVEAMPVASVAVSPDSRALIVGETAQLSAVLRGAQGNDLAGRAVTWTSSADAVATVSETGLVTAVAPGSATITATSEGKSGTASITVNPVPVASVRVAPATLALTVGESAPLTAEPLDSKGNALPGRTVVWESTDEAVATVDAAGRVTAKASGNVTVRATSEAKTGSASVTVTPVPVASVTVEPTSVTLEIGDTRQLAATPRDADENPLADRVVTWSSSNDNFATVDASGLVTAVGPGTATITATSETKTGTASVEVRPPAVASVSVSPDAADVIVGQSTQLTATPLDARGNALPGREIAWASEDEDIATVDDAGRVTATRVGQATIRATSEGKRGTATINALPVPVATVVVEPASAALIIGDQIDLTAEPRDAAGNPLTGRDVDWTSSDDGVARVDDDGRVSALAVGSVTITATSGGQSGTSAVAVAAPVAASATAVAGDGQTGPAGEALPVALVVRVLDTRGRAISNVPVAWTVTEGGGSAAPLAPVTEAEGLASAVWTLGPATGTNRVRAAAEGVPEVVDFTATATGAIVVSIEVTPGTTQLEAIGATVTLTAHARGRAGQELPDAAIGWHSRNPDVATVDENGVVTARENGSAEIAAQSGGQEGAALVVVQQRVVTITVTPAAPLVDEGALVALTAAGADANGVAVSAATFAWESSDTAVATVDGTGLVTAVAPGTATITARADAATGAATVTVQVAAEPVVTRVGVQPTHVRRMPQHSGRLAARAFPAGGDPSPGRPDAWRVTDANVATVRTDGVARGVRKGKAAVVARTGIASDDAEIQVE